MSYNCLPPAAPKVLVDICGPALAVVEPEAATVYTHDPSNLSRVPNSGYTISSDTRIRFMTAHKTQLATLDTSNVLHLAVFDVTKKKDHFGKLAEWKLPKSEIYTSICWNHDGTALVLSTTNGTLYRINTVTHQMNPFGAMVGGAVTSVSAAPCGDNVFAIAHKTGSISVLRITHQLEVYHTFKLSSRGSGADFVKSHNDVEQLPQNTSPVYALTTAWHYSSRDPANQSLAAIDSNNKVQVWSVSLKSMVRKIRCFGLPEGAHSASPIWWTKGGSLFHALNDSRVCIHNVKTANVSTKIISTGKIVSCSIKSNRGKAWLATTMGIEFLDLVAGDKRTESSKKTDSKQKTKTEKRGSDSSTESQDSAEQRRHRPPQIALPTPELLPSPPRPLPRRSPFIPIPSEAPPPVPPASAQSDSWDDESDGPSSAFSNTRSSNTSADTLPSSTEYDVPVKPLLNCRPKTRFSGQITPTRTEMTPIDTSRISLFHIDMSVSDPNAEKALSPSLSWECQALRVLFDWELSCYELIQSQRSEDNTIANFYLGQWLNDSDYTLNIDSLESTLSPTQSTALLCLSLLDREPSKVEKAISVHISRVRRRLPSAALDTHYVCTTLLSLGLAHQAIHVYQQLGFYMEAVILGILYAQSIEETLDLWMYSAASSDVWPDGVVHRCSVLMSLVNPQVSYPVTFEDRDPGAHLPASLRKVSLDDLLKSSQNNPNLLLDSPMIPHEEFSVGIDSPTLMPVDFDRPPNFSRRGRTPKTSPNLI
ncbi:hypothetical protein CJU90_1869 [Yarrowia sp. C11]|nr:hypothetical protein CKK34_5897 [Yarrowia sp. E02]KAG5371806.1 hypothetical protein CJU90_1869 [Yarrowia sp. C11]